MRDGSTDLPINLAQLQQLVAVTGGVAVLDGMGNLAMIPKSLTDAFLMTKAGVIAWGDSMPKSNLFNTDDITPYRGKLLTLGCAANNQVEIGFLDIDESEYIGIDADGNPVGRSFCDATAVDTLDSLFGCNGGVFSKLNGIAGKKIIINDDGKFELVDAASDAPTWFDTKVTVCQKRTGYTDNASFAIEDATLDVPFGGLYAGTYDMTVNGSYTPGSSVAICRCVVGCNVRASGTESHAQVILNGLVILEGWIDSTYEFGFQNTLIVEVPLDEDKFDFELVAVSDGSGHVKTHAKLELVGFK
jgi:hypothetical protein